MDQPVLELAAIFRSVQAVMEVNRLALNQADSINGNHGDHMVEIFSTAVRAAQEMHGVGLVLAMQSAAERLLSLPDNATAHIYGRGLSEFARVFDKYQIQLEDLEWYVQGLLGEQKVDEDRRTGTSAALIIKALVEGLACWQQEDDAPTKTAGLLDLGYMFDLGIAYMQAKQRSSNRVEVIADAATSVSPLNKSTHRSLSGRLAIQALLEALAQG